MSNLDIKNLKIAKRYALALLETANDEKEFIFQDLKMVNETIFENKDFMMFFSHPVVSLKDKKDTLDETLRGRLNQKSLNFLQTLLDENRFNIFQTIFALYQKEMENRENKQQVEIISAVELDEVEKAKLKAKLDNKLNKDTILNYYQDRDILGGLIIKLDDKVVDLSLRNKFNKLKNKI